MTPIESVFMLNADSVYDESIVLEVLSEGHSRVPVYKDNKHNIIGILLTKRLLNIDLSTQRKVSDLELYKIPRVFDSTPMYDMLRLMQSGKSHMALIVDSEVYETNKKEVVNDQKKDELQVDLEDSTENKTPRNQPQLINEFESVISHDYHSGDDLSSIFNQSDKENMLESSEIDEMEGQKVIGIITLEDIFEELLQKEIVDETDVFVDVHQRVRVVEIFRKLSSSGPKFSHSKRKSSFTIPIAGLGNVNKKELMTNDEKLKLLKSSKKEK
ncbi:metal transporter cnnm-5 [Anaeramoeba ignava]|uniref:Metal transporter cnnm-5 n=1 Tax=Anaeramoeba ignava TaxID=1746090 RepID=A0A9Q0RHI1_ANAIG|nr:metal transporter cnnm-5 [Anaeramoeba ignava]